MYCTRPVLSWAEEESVKCGGDQRVAPLYFVTIHGVDIFVYKCYTLIGTLEEEEGVLSDQPEQTRVATDAC